MTYPPGVVYRRFQSHQFHVIPFILGFGICLPRSRKNTIPTYLVRNQDPFSGLLSHEGRTKSSSLVLYTCLVKLHKYVDKKEQLMHFEASKLLLTHFQLMLRLKNMMNTFLGLRLLCRPLCSNSGFLFCWLKTQPPYQRGGGGGTKIQDMLGRAGRRG